MFLDKGKYFEIDEFEKNGVRAIYTTKNIGNIDELFKTEKGIDNILSIFGKKSVAVVYAKQEHTNFVVDITDKTGKYFYEGIDGFITQRKDIVLMTQYADCLPIYFYDTENKVIGVSHSGWKGTFSEIGIKTLELMEKNYDSQRKNILIGMGIGISCDKYEVGDEFYQNFKEKFGDEFLDKSFKFINGKWHFDNTLFNRENFIKNGILEKNIIISNECTFKNERFHSFRRDRNSCRNAGIIFFK